MAIDDEHDDLPLQPPDSLLLYPIEVIASQAGSLWASQPERQAFELDNFAAWLRIPATRLPPDADLLHEAAAFLTGYTIRTAAQSQEFWAALIPSPLPSDTDKLAFLKMFLQAAWKSMNAKRELQWQYLRR